jgi:hypothetical protein
LEEFPPFIVRKRTELTPVHQNGGQIGEIFLALVAALVEAE